MAVKAIYLSVIFTFVNLFRKNNLKADTCPNQPVIPDDMLMEEEIIPFSVTEKKVFLPELLIIRLTDPLFKVKKKKKKKKNLFGKEKKIEKK